MHPLILLLIASIFGCTTIGPKTLTRDRFEYSNSLATSWQNQMLLNIVKMRYLDVPMFLDITSVINSYTLEGRVNLDFDLVQGGNNSQSLGGTGTYSDRPTITYRPLTGDLYLKSLLTPVKPESLVFLIQAGLNAKWLLSLTTKSINGVFNYNPMKLEPSLADPRFFELCEAMWRIQRASAIGIRKAQTGDRTATIIAFNRQAPDEILADIQYVKESLGLDPEVDEVRVRYGTVPSNDRELVMLTRSMYEVLAAISWGVEVPQEDLDKNRASRILGSPGFEPLVRIYSAESKPEEAHVIIKHRNHWFWIEDNDLDSKMIFNFMVILFTLSETGERGPDPVLTIPAG